MVTPFRKEVLMREPFIKNEVQFNIFHRMIEGNLDIAVMVDNSIIALYSTGRSMWLWVNEDQDKESIEKHIFELCDRYKEYKLFGVSGEPPIAKAFAKRYSELLGIDFKLPMGMEAYCCTKVIKPQNVRGEMISAKTRHTDIVALYCANFNGDCFGKKATIESQMDTAKHLIDAANLYLWVVDNTVVSMANIAHTSPNQARINCVYTQPQKRKNGFASALVSELSKQILDEGLIPMLYADIKNPDSNKVYKGIGFSECGKIFDYEFIY